MQLLRFGPKISLNIPTAVWVFRGFWLLGAEVGLHTWVRSLVEALEMFSDLMLSCAETNVILVKADKIIHVSFLPPTALDTSAKCHQMSLLFNCCLSSSSEKAAGRSGATD